MGDRAADDLAGPIKMGEGGLRIDDLKLDLAADEFQRGVAHQHTGQQTGLAQGLKTVADAEYGYAGFGAADDLAQDRKSAEMAPARR